MSDCIAASAMMYESAHSGPSVAPPIAMGSSAGPDTTTGVAKASSPVGEPPPKRAVRPLSEDVKFVWSALPAEAMVELTADSLSSDGCSPSAIWSICTVAPRPQQPRKRPSPPPVSCRTSQRPKLHCIVLPRAAGLNYLQGSYGD